MPDSTHLLGFLTAALVLALIPGPGMLYVLARSLAGGRTTGLRSTLGTAIGGCVHVVAASVGMSAIIAASALGFSIVRFAGAAYLIWLGARMLLNPGPPPRFDAKADGGADRGVLRQGIFTEILNPKTALFFLTFLPQFCQPENGPVALQLAVLGVVCVALNSSTDIVVAFVAGSLGRKLRADGRWWLRQRRASGGVLVALGLYAAAFNGQSSSR